MSTLYDKFSEFDRKVLRVIEAEDQLRHDADTLKEEVLKKITNKEIPLEERYKFWVDLPDILKNDEPWLQDLTLRGERIEWFSELYYKKYQRVSVVDLVHYVEHESDEGQFTEEDVIDLKEQVLSRNLRSFRLDW